MTCTRRLARRRHSAPPLDDQCRELNEHSCTVPSCAGPPVLHHDPVQHRRPRARGSAWAHHRGCDQPRQAPVLGGAPHALPPGEPRPRAQAASRSIRCQPTCTTGLAPPVSCSNPDAMPLPQRPRQRSAPPAPCRPSFLCLRAFHLCRACSRARTPSTPSAPASSPAPSPRARATRPPTSSRNTSRRAENEAHPHVADAPPWLVHVGP